MKIIHPGGRPLGIDAVTPTTHVIPQARQRSRFSQVEIQPYYMDVLGLRRIDEDAPPDPENFFDVAGRVSGIVLSGPVQETGQENFGVWELAGDGKRSMALDGLVGNLELTKPDGLCTRDVHTRTHIDEFNVAARYRSQGVGGETMRFAAGRGAFHPEDEITLDVHEASPAQDLYRERWEFEAGQRLGCLGVYEGEHIRMHVPGAIFLQRLTERD